MKPRVVIAAFVAACSGGGRKPVSSEGPLPPNDPVATSSTPSAQGSVAPEGAQRERTRTITPAEMTWAALDGNQVSQLWGDRTTEPNGFMMKLRSGDRGTLHTHTGDVHGVSILGATEVGQDASGANATVAQAYWFLPGGVPHRYACGDDRECLVFVHFNEGKFDIAPANATKGAKDARFVVKRLAAITWLPIDEKTPSLGALAPLWGDARAAANGMFVKLPAGSTPFWKIHKHDFHAVVLRGTVQHFQSGSAGEDLPVGTYLHQPAGYKHTTNCAAGGECILYVFHTGAYDLKPAP